MKGDETVPSPKDIISCPLHVFHITNFEKLWHPVHVISCPSTPSWNQDSICKIEVARPISLSAFGFPAWVLCLFLGGYPCNNLWSTRRSPRFRQGSAMRPYFHRRSSRRWQQWGTAAARGASFHVEAPRPGLLGKGFLTTKDTTIIPSNK